MKKYLYVLLLLIFLIQTGLGQLNNENTKKTST